MEKNMEDEMETKEYTGVKQGNMYDAAVNRREPF